MDSTKISDSAMLTTLVPALLLVMVRFNDGIGPKQNELAFLDHGTSTFYFINRAMVATYTAVSCLHVTPNLLKSMMPATVYVRDASLLFAAMVSLKMPQVCVCRPPVAALPTPTLFSHHTHRWKISTCCAQRRRSSRSSRCRKSRPRR